MWYPWDLTEYSYCCFTNMVIWAVENSVREATWALKGHIRAEDKSSYTKIIQWHLKDGLIVQVILFKGKDEKELLCRRWHSLDRNAWLWFLGQILGSDLNLHSRMYPKVSFLGIVLSFSRLYLKTWYQLNKNIWLLNQK